MIWQIMLKTIALILKFYKNRVKTMINSSSYTFIILSISTGLLSLLSSVGIFISLIIQRRVDRLQEILEEFINLSYRNETNLTSLMYNFIEKYQMHYMFPQKPLKLITQYIDCSIIFVSLLWAGSLLIHYKPPFSPLLFLQISPLIIGIYTSFFFRKLLRDTINLENPLLETIVPAPTKLRSISYLSHFINISVKSILQQARLTLHLSWEKDEQKGKKINVLLKQELSFDDFFYFLLLSNEEKPCFISFGELSFCFPPDKITGKPVPAQRNINVPLGHFHYNDLPEKLTAEFLVFTQGEKYPIQYDYQLTQGTNFLSSQSSPQVNVNHQIVYTFEEEKIKILSCEANIPFLRELNPFFHLNCQRYYINNLAQMAPDNLHLSTCNEETFID